MKAIARSPGAFVHGIDGPVVIVPGRIAAWLEREYRLDRRRIEIRGADAEFDSVLCALGVAAGAWRTSVSGSEQRKPSEAASGSTVMSTADVADHLGHTESAVRQAIRSGRLKAAKSGRQWVVEREDLAHYEAATAAN